MAVASLANQGSGKSDEAVTDNAIKHCIGCAGDVATKPVHAGLSGMEYCRMVFITFAHACGG